MADQLYLSLWFPNFRMQALPEKLVSVLHQFARVSGNRRISAANAYPLSWHEVPSYERIYVADRAATEKADVGTESFAENAVPEATERLDDDTAYEFEVRWPLWTPENGEGLDIVWKEVPSLVRVIGYGPEFDDAAYESNGHIRIDFGLDSLFLLEDIELDPIATQRVQQNVEKLVAFTLSVEKHCGISSRLLWTESGESIAQKLIDRLQRVN
ncbi:MAG TPA: hypothetical protein VGB94_02550 [Acidobacteriaceae bacterium]